MQKVCYLHISLKNMNFYGELKCNFNISFGKKELREAFRLYDKEGNGYIPTTCLREILRELDDQLTEHELDIMIEEIDSDGSGTVDFDGEMLASFFKK